MMGKKRDKSELLIEKYSVKWLTPWAECVVYFDEGEKDLTLATSISPCPVFSPAEWQRFCGAVNNKINLKEKDE